METFLFITSAIFLASAGYFHNRLDTEFNRTTKGILFTAGVVYTYMGLLYANNSDVVIRGWRYLDWFITVPLLITELYKFLDVKLRQQRDLVLAIVFALLMLGLGLLGELHYMNKWLANITGSIFGIGVFYILFRKIPKQHFKFLTTVAVLWSFYPIVYIIEDSVLTIISFSIVDLSAKVGTAFYIKYKEDSL